MMTRSVMPSTGTFDVDAGADMHFLASSQWEHTPSEHRAATKDTLIVSYAGHGATYTLRQCARETLFDTGKVDLTRLHIQIQRRSKSYGCPPAALEVMDAIAVAEFREFYGQA